MAHEDAGHYAAKHPKGTTLNQKIAEALRAKVLDGRISCAAAHKIAKELQVSPKEVGMTADLLEIRIIACQLGLFGHSPQGKIVQPATHVAPELQQAIAEARDEKGISCFTAWEIAEQFTITRLEVSSACETLNVKITSCQLGMFGK